MICGVNNDKTFYTCVPFIYLHKSFQQVENYSKVRHVNKVRGYERQFINQPVAAQPYSSTLIIKPKPPHIFGLIITDFAVNGGTRLFNTTVFSSAFPMKI